MRILGDRSLCGIILGVLICMVLISPSAANAQWRAAVGAQSEDKGRQAAAFLPNELWIHAGDDITWTWFSDDIHTVTFLRPDQVRPDFSLGCPGVSASGASFDGSTCVTTPPMVTGATFNVVFSTPGNYKMVCLVHEDMTGTIHVLDPSAPLPHDQAFYDKQAAEERRELLADTDQGHAHGRDLAPPNAVTAGVGEVVATGGGHQIGFVVRFFQHDTVIHAGETAEWTNDDSINPHTITFGAEPGNPFPPSTNVTTDADGALHATISSPSDNVHSGFIVSAPQERLGLAQAPLGRTRFRITFTKPGTYPYRCVLHDNLGMTGRVIVLP